MKKIKILSIFLIMTILFSVVSPIASFALADTNAKIAIVNSEGAGVEVIKAPGETFTVNVNFQNGSEKGLALAGAVKFDNKKLKITNLSDNLVGGSYNITGKKNIATSEESSVQNRVFWSPTDKSEYVTFLFQSDDTQIKSGLAFPLEFEVLDGATGTFDVEFYNVKYIEDANDEVEVLLGLDVGSKITGKVKTPLKSISLNKTETTIGVGGTETLTVTHTPDTTTDSKDITWTSSNEAIATVDNQGNVTAVAPGEATITATSAVANVKPVTCKVSVTSKLKSIKLNKTSVEMSKEDTEILEITYIPDNTTDNKNITWTSSNEAVATVDQKGKITAIALGDTTITATSAVEGVEPVTCSVKVTSKLKGISLNETAFNLNKNETKELKVSYDPFDATDIGTVTWSSNDPSIATVSNTGDVTAVNKGTTHIIATCNGKTATAEVTVKIPLTSITIEQGDRIEINPMQELSLSIKYSSDDTTDSKTIVWESDDETIATVDSTGKVTAIKPGTATITATCGTHTDTIDIKVLEVHIESIEFKEPIITLNKTEEKQNEIIFYPDYTTDSREVTYSSEDEDIATVDANGKIVAKGKGTTNIVAKAGKFEAKCKVTVLVPLTGISLNKTEVEVIKNDTVKLSVNYNEDDTTDNKTITWTSLNEKVATVNDDGTVTAKSAGTAVIKAQVGNYEVKCEVTVKVPMTGIEIKDSTKLIKNQSETLIVTYLPEDTTDDRTVTWSSEDETIAKVDKNGKITALKEGTTNIIAKVGNFEDKCEITVEEIKLQGIVISNKADSIQKGEKLKLEVLFTPENTTDDKNVEWFISDNSVISIDDKGNVEGLKAGKATITARSGSFEDEFEIEIVEITLTGMEITNTSEDKKLEVGGKLQLDVKFTPENTTDSKNLKYLSSDDSIISVDNKGMVTALKSGTATITVIADNGVKTQIELTVEEKTVVDDKNDVNNNLDNKEEIGKVEENKKDESPKTGDINIVLYIGLVIVSLFGIVKFRKTSKTTRVRNK